VLLAIGWEDFVVTPLYIHFKADSLIWLDGLGMQGMDQHGVASRSERII